MIISSSHQKCLLLAVLFIAFHIVNPQSNYCSICRDHTMCLNSGVAARCRAGVFRKGINAAERAQIVKLHNNYRNRVASGAERRGKPGPQPSAANMQRLYWDNELANVAQRWADQCLYNHDKCRNVARYSVGQNLARGTFPCNSNTNADWNGMVALWYKEVAIYNNREVDSYRFSLATGHYTQLVWAKTKRIGCGYTVYQEGRTCRKYYVCNYGPSGNFPRQRVYVRGRPRSQCPAGATRTSAYPALC